VLSPNPALRAKPAFLTALLLRQPIAACLLRCTTISLLDIVSTMPSSRNRREPLIQATLGCLATKGCEKCGLTLGGQPLTRPSATLSPLRGARGLDVGASFLSRPSHSAGSFNRVPSPHASGEKVERSEGST